MNIQNFGELIVAKVSPELAQQCEKYSSEKLPWDIQKEYLNFTYTDISAELLKIWQIPEKIILPIRHYNESSSNQINKDVKVLYLASRLALVDSHPEEFVYDETIDESLCKSLNISADDLIDAASFASQEAENILNIMNVNLFTRK